MVANLDPNYLSIHLRLFDDLVDMLPEYSAKEAQLDRATVEQRVACEGYAFVMKTMPALGKHFECALESGSFNPFPGLKREKGRTTPLFLRGLFKGVFDDEGYIRETPCTTSVRGIRQVLYFQYKLEVEYDDELVNEFIQEFVNTDESLTHCEDLDWEQRLILEIASFVNSRIFGDLDHRDIRPRPGPGASADGTHRVYRFEPLNHYEAIHEVYPYYDYFYLGSMHLLDRRSAYLAMGRKSHGSSLVRLVPKDSRGPRIICMEPQEYMFLQQGLGASIRNRLERHRLSRGRVNFDDQSINRRLALESSLSRGYATLDMKDASDRISRKLVERMFCKVPGLQKALLALSTPETILPDGTRRKHRKFAPMGSSLCFPTMSAVHYALGLACLHVRTGKPITALAKENSIYVYGDDLVVKTEYVNHLFELFPRFGLRFNEQKSFKSGYFRESCGLDAYKGVCVTPLRLKKRFLDTVNKRTYVECMSAAFDMHFNLKTKGWVRAAATLKTLISERHGSFPTVMFGSEIFGWRTNCPTEIEGLPPRVFHRPWHNWTFRARVIKTEPDSSMMGSWEQLVRSLTTLTQRSTRVDGRFTKVRTCVKRVAVQSAYGPVIPKFRLTET